MTGVLAMMVYIGCYTDAEHTNGIFAAEARPAVLGFFIGSLLNGAGQAIPMMNLTQGGRALAYAIPQQAFLFPYLWGLAFWGQRLGALSVVGILLIGGAVFYLATTRNADRSSSLPPRRITGYSCPAFAAFMLPVESSTMPSHVVTNISAGLFWQI